MKTKNKFLQISLISCTLSAILLFAGCKKNDNEKDDFTSTAEDIGQAESIYSDVDNMVAQVAEAEDINQRLAAPTDDGRDQFNITSCATVTKDTVNHIITIDFGSSCIGRDGKTRSGQIIITYTGVGYFTPGASWTITFNNFYVGGRHVEGTRTVTNNGMDASNFMSWSINAVNMRITRPDGSWRTWDSQRTREMIAGYGDSTRTNDTYRINGTASSTHSNGESCSATMTNLVRDFSCYFITSGTIVIVPSNRPERTIDFGNGTCDAEATVTKNGMTRTIYLRP